jgi:hypothetical protein
MFDKLFDQPETEADDIEFDEAKLEELTDEQLHR